MRGTCAVRSATDVEMGLLTAVKGLFGSKKQDFLEADPYWDQSTVPINTFKTKAPFTAKVVSTKRIVGPQVKRQRARAARGEECVLTSRQRRRGGMRSLPPRPRAQQRVRMAAERRGLEQRRTERTAN